MVVLGVPCGNSVQVIASGGVPGILACALALHVRAWLPCSPGKLIESFCTESEKALAHVLCCL